ncbi:MAG: hypothetical protein KJ667_07300 [Alphaproteobacteria bacterium]|nr:hypothetical protein [Alphaproteobacteria bacterium]
MTRGAFKGVCILSLFCVLTLSAPGQAHAARFSGKYLLELCDFGPDGKEKIAGGHAACQAYIAGVLDYHAFLQGMKIAPKTDICVPQSATMNQVHAVVLKYLKANTQHDGFVAAPAVTTALYQVYACRKKK